MYLSLHDHGYLAAVAALSLSVCTPGGGGIRRWEYPPEVASAQICALVPVPRLAPCFGWLSSHPYGDHGVGEPDRF